MTFAARLVDRGLLEEAQWQAWSAAHPVPSEPGDLLQALIDARLLAAAEGLAVWAEDLGCDHAPHIEEAWFEERLLDGLSVDYLRRRRVLPVRRDGQICLLLGSHAALEEVHDMSVMLGTEPSPVLVLPEQLSEAIDRAFTLAAGESSPDTLSHESATAESDLPEDLLRAAGDAPAVRWVNDLLVEAARAGASDIHLEPVRSRLAVRLRVDGVLRARSGPPAGLDGAVVSRIKVLAQLDIAERRLPQDGMTKVRMGGREMDVRVSTVPVRGGERVVLRLLRHDTGLQPLTDLGMSGALLTSIRRVVTQPHGVIWVTGPTGSGKTTTLYAALAELDARRRNILTIEDPVEYELPGIGQISVRPRIGLTFATGLRHILRQDPDVILVGETRDRETAEIVVQASLTGHLVFSTLHTNDALGAVTRLVDMGVPPFLVAEATRAVLAQRLVRRLDPEQCEPFTVTEADCGGYTGLIGTTAYRPRADLDHEDAAFAGRVGVFDLVELDPELQEAIRENRSTTDLYRLLGRRAADGLRADAEALIRSGNTSIDEVVRRLGDGGGV